jgi:hypothetical protein
MGLISGSGRRGRGGRDGASAPEHVKAEHMIPEDPKVDRAAMAAREDQRKKRGQS